MRQAVTLAPEPYTHPLMHSNTHGSWSHAKGPPLTHTAGSGEIKLFLKMLLMSYYSSCSKGHLAIHAAC